MATSWLATARGCSNCRRKWPHKSPTATRGRYSRINASLGGGGSCGRYYRAGAFDPLAFARRVHRRPQIAASLPVQPEVRAVTEHAGKDERSGRGHGPAVVAELVDVLAWHGHGLGQRALC